MESGILCGWGTSRPLVIHFCVGVICWFLLLLLFVTFWFSISCLALSHKMDPQAFWLHEGKLFMAKREVVNRGWLSDAHSSKKLKGQWKKASSLGMCLSAKYSGAREPTFADADIILPTVVFGKYEEAAKTISDEKLRLLPSPQVFDCMYNFRFAGLKGMFLHVLHVCMFCCSMQDNQQKVPHKMYTQKMALLMKFQVQMAPLMKRCCPLLVLWGCPMLPHTRVPFFLIVTQFLVFFPTGFRPHFGGAAEHPRSNFQLPAARPISGQSILALKIGQFRCQGRETFAPQEAKWHCLVRCRHNACPTIRGVSSSQGQALEICGQAHGACQAS